MKVLFDANYPKYLVNALQLVHQLDTKELFAISYWQKEQQTSEDSVVFIFDRSKKGLDITTLKCYEAGYKVFAFKLPAKEKIDLFNFSLTVLNIWPKVLETVTDKQKPFIYTYRYGGRKLKKVVE